MRKIKGYNEYRRVSVNVKTERTFTPKKLLYLSCKVSKSIGLISFYIYVVGTTISRVRMNG